LGKGGFGTVFAVDEGRLGALGHSGKVAVKRMDDGNMQGVHQLQNEIDILALCRHEHLLPLLGFCLEAEARCLVYPLMAGGTLEDALSSSAAMPLTWKARVRILSATARALLFLHTPSGAKGVILHRDVKPANILLDQHLNAKLSDVGLALHKPSTMHKDRVSDELTGTIGFLDPIYSRAARVSKRAHVCRRGHLLPPPRVGAAR
jgi:serine/threonine protein kinase